MKRLIAKRRLRRTCIYCGRSFIKGEVYYKDRKVYEDFSEGYSSCLIAYENLICPKCRYKDEQWHKRFEKFKKHCTHPAKFRDTAWHYIPGECVKEPEYDYCQLCGARF